MSDGTATGRDGWRLGALYGAYFAFAGIVAPYLPLYFQHRGLAAFEVGMLVAMGQAMRVVGPNFWGYLADHATRRTPILRSTAVALLLAFALLLAPGGFGYVFGVMLLVNLFQTAQMPIAEALASASMRGHPDAATRYGRLRVWGSTAFVVVVLTAGPLFDRFGIGLALGLGLAILAVLVAASWQVTEARHGEHPPDSVSVSQRLREPCVRWFLLSAGLMIFAHGALYAYLSIYLAQLGYSKTSIGVFWVLSVLLEIVFFVTQGRWIRRFGLYPLLVASFVAASVRFMLIAEFAAIWWILAFAQILHAMTFAVHHSASVLTVQRWFSGRAAARGQAIYISAAWGLGGTLGGLMAAFLWSFAGPRWAFGAGSIAAVLGLLAIRRARQNDPAFPSPERVGFKLERSPE